MNSNQGNSLDYSGQFESNTVLELSTQKTDPVNGTKYVLIKHDYYASDNDNGRELLSRFLSALCDSTSGSLTVYLIDQGTKLLDKNNLLYTEMINFIEKAETVIADSDSLSFYDVEAVKNPKVVLQDSNSIVEDLIYIPDIFILE